MSSAHRLEPRRFATAHLGALLFQDGLARQPMRLPSTASTFTSTWSPSFSSSRTSLMRCSATSLMCSRPSVPGNDLHERAEVRQPRDLAEIGLADFGGRGDVADHLQRLVRPPPDRWTTTFTLPLSSTSILTPVCLDDAANHLAAGPDQVADLVGRNLQGVEARSELADLGARLARSPSFILSRMNRRPRRPGPAPRA